MIVDFFGAGSTLLPLLSKGSDRAVQSSFWGLGFRV